MIMTKERQIEIVAAQILRESGDERIGYSEARAIAGSLDIPLPFECENVSYFMFKAKSSQTPQIGYIFCNSLGVYNLHVSGLAMIYGVSMDKLHKSIGEVVMPISDWVYLTNPLGLPDPIAPDRPESTTYRFQYLKNGLWNDANVQVVGKNGKKFYISAGPLGYVAHSPQAFWDYIESEGICKIYWNDECDILKKSTNNLKEKQ